MEPYKTKSMPLDYKIDKDMLKLISEANVKYGEYKSLLNTLEFDASYFLDSVILNESYKSQENNRICANVFADEKANKL